MFGFYSFVCNLYYWYYPLIDESVGIPIDDLSDNSDTFDIPTLTINKIRNSF